MVINEEEKNAFTQSVMGDTEGGGGGGGNVTFVDYLVEEDGDVLNMPADELFETCKKGMVIFIERESEESAIENLHMLGSALYDEYEGVYIFNVFYGLQALEFTALLNAYPKHTYN